MSSALALAVPLDDEHIVKYLVCHPDKVQELMNATEATFPAKTDIGVLVDRFGGISVISSNVAAKNRGYWMNGRGRIIKVIDMGVAANEAT